jgi:hypothetical protein
MKQWWAFVRRFLFSWIVITIHWEWWMVHVNGSPVFAFPYAYVTFRWEPAE